MYIVSPSTINQFTRSHTALIFYQRKISPYRYLRPARYSINNLIYARGTRPKSVRVRSAAIHLHYLVSISASRQLTPICMVIRSPPYLSKGSPNYFSVWRPPATHAIPQHCLSDERAHVLSATPLIDLNRVRVASLPRIFGNFHLFREGINSVLSLPRESIS